VAPGRPQLPERRSVDDRRHRHPVRPEYGRDYPAVWGLEILPAYDAIARVKSRGHWQTDVLAGFAVGTGTGYWAHVRENPFILGLLPGGFYAGFKRQF
jgi:undecaprenyl-diphosphatase